MKKKKKMVIKKKAREPARLVIRIVKNE